jgi:adenosylhomocysteine nucleosidase
MRIGWITGLAAEARIVRSLGMVGVGGGFPAGATAAAERLVADGAAALVSFGLCGGLDPALRPGSIVVPKFCMDGQHHMTNPDLAALLGGWSARALCATDAVVATASAKRALFATTGAVAVDMESGAVARVAERHGLPFAVLRAVCDPAGSTLPPAALLALDQSGTIGVWRVATSVLAAPAQLPALLRLARDAARARAALIRRVGDIGRRRRLMS